MLFRSIKLCLVSFCTRVYIILLRAGGKVVRKRIGLQVVTFPAPFTPSVEIGWRLGFDHWGKGYATEGAMAALKTGFEALNLNEIVSFTAVPNLRSQAVMQKIGMHHNLADDFNHPKLAIEHKLCRHVLYRLNQDEWQKNTKPHLELKN